MSLKRNFFRDPDFTRKARLIIYFWHISHKVMELVQVISVRALLNVYIGICLRNNSSRQRARRRFQPTSANSCWTADGLGPACCEECVPCNWRVTIQLICERFVPTSFFLGEPWVHNVCIHLLPPKLRRGKGWRRNCWLDFSLPVAGPSSVLV